MSGWDYHHYGVLLVDEDVTFLRSLSERLATRFRVRTALSVDSALEILRADDPGVGVLLAGPSLTDHSGKPVLSHARERHPLTLRVLMVPPGAVPPTPDSMLANDLYQWIPRSAESPALEPFLLRALDYYRLQAERRDTRADRALVAHRLLVMDRILSLGILSTDLGQRLRHVMAALRSFMDLAAPRLEAGGDDLLGLLQENAWKTRSDASRRHWSSLHRTLHDVGDCAKPFLPTFNDQTSPHQLLTRACERFKSRLAEKDLQVANEIPKNLPTLKSDEALLDRMMDAFLEEALITFPSGSTLRMDGVKESEQLVRLQWTWEGNAFRPERLGWVFNPFDEPPAGSPRPGLHLLAAFLVVYHHGGVVNCNFQSGIGCSLRMHLPVDPDKLVVTEGERNILSNLLFSDGLWEDFLLRET